ncbi:putative malate dehydrogenase 1B isoform X2 [Hyperolius riggenbachi]|uniref:putative malate dehydrogenase 1B isoform X2 n=1 Tax=Hyperolius riggenbachi TaxID=752182 RepID=UPI0035A2DD5C
MQWLSELCLRNGWKHRRSPIIWRELLDRGSKGLLLGGFNEFMEHVQEYYGVTSAMLSDLMKDIAAENMEACINLHIEEDEVKQHFNPLHVWITSASVPTCYSLIPLLASGEVFAMDQAICIHLLDSSEAKDTMYGLKMEAEDLAYPCLREVMLHTMDDKVFLQADVIVVLDDFLPRDGQPPEDNIKMVSEQCMQYGSLINQNAKKDVKVVVSGSTYTNLKTLIIMKNAPSINYHNIVALSTQLEFEVKAQIAQKLNVNSSMVKDVIVWGNISGINHHDLQQANIYKYDSSIWGPSNFSRPLLPMIFDRKWMKNHLEAEWKNRKHHRSGLSAAHSIASFLSWWQHTSNGEIVSLGVLCKGQFDVPGDIVYSMPVQLEDGNWKVYTNVTIPEDVKTILQQAASELIKEKHIALGMPLEEEVKRQEEQAITEDSTESGITDLQVSFSKVEVPLHE